MMAHTHSALLASLRALLVCLVALCIVLKLVELRVQARAALRGCELLRPLVGQLGPNTLIYSSSMARKLCIMLHIVSQVVTLLASRLEVRA